MANSNDIIATMAFLLGGSQTGGNGASSMLSTQPSSTLNNQINMPANGGTPNTFASTVSGLNISQTTGNNTFASTNQAQNMSTYNVPNQITRINGRCTIRQLTSLIPEWRGHFDVANLLLTKQENALDTVKNITEDVVELNKNVKNSYEDIKNTLNGVTIQQEKLQQELLTRIKYQDEQNLTSIKARRLAESIHDADQNGKLSATSFRVPNHLHVQLSKDLLDRVRNMNNEVKTLRKEVKGLRNIDLIQAVNVVDSVVRCQTARINQMGELLSHTLVKTESVLRDGKSELWDSVAGTNKVRKAFLNAVGVVLTPNDNAASRKDGECENVEFVKMQSTHEVTRQIDYLRRFNNAFMKFDVSGLDDTHYNIKDLLQQPSYTAGSYGTTVGMETTNTAPGLFGNIGTNQATMGQPSNTIFGSSTTGGGLFSSSRPSGATNLYGLNTTGQTNTVTNNTGTGLGYNFGSGSTSFNTATGQSSSIFSQPATTNIFTSGSQQGTTTTPVGGQMAPHSGPTSTIFGQTAAATPNIFGNIAGTTPNTAGTIGANTPLGTNTWGHGTSSATANLGLPTNAAPAATTTLGSGNIFGGTTANPQTAPTTSSAFNTRVNPSGGLFGNTSSGFGATTTFGNVGFNQPANTTQAGTSAFGGSNLFGKQNAAKSTEIVLYQPQKN